MTQCGATGSLKRQAVAETANTHPGPRPATAMKLRLLIQRNMVYRETHQPHIPVWTGDLQGPCYPGVDW